MLGPRESFCLRRSRKLKSYQGEPAGRWRESWRSHVWGIIRPCLVDAAANNGSPNTQAAIHIRSTGSAIALGIPLIVVSLALGVAAIFYHPLWMLAAGLFVFGWLLQFIGHAFEHKEPEFFHDWRFLLVGVRWWWAKMRGKA